MNARGYLLTGACASMRESLTLLSAVGRCGGARGSLA